MGATYTDNQIPIGSIVATITSAPPATAAVVSNAVWDDFNINLPEGLIVREDEVGKENGWALIATTLASGKHVTATGTVQVKTSSTTNQLSGHAISYAFVPGSTATSTFIIGQTGIPYSKDGYWKVNCTLHLSRTPPTA